MAPPSQKSLSIGFWLSAGPGGAGQPAGGGLLGMLSSPAALGAAVLNDLGFGGNTHVTLTIRPEDLTYVQPSRLAVEQTLGGAWADDFGPGVSTINISGHTGWRGGFLSSGQDEFFSLRDAVFSNWHKQRAEAVKNGKDPDADTSLYFSDSLNSISVRCAPRSFTLRRSRSRPLLYMYQIQLVVLDDAGAPDSLLDAISQAISNPLRFLSGLGALGNIISAIRNGAVSQAIAIGTTAVSQFVNLGAGILEQAASAISTAEGQISGASAVLLGVAATYSRAAANAFQALACDDTLPADLRIPIAETASLFNAADLCCRTSFGTARIYNSYDDLFGASGCSSTAGGQPFSEYALSGMSGLASIYVPASPLISVTPAAGGALSMLCGEPLQFVGQQAAVVQLLGTAAGGVSLP